MAFFTQPNNIICEKLNSKQDRLQKLNSKQDRLRTTLIEINRFGKSRVIAVTRGKVYGERDPKDDWLAGSPDGVVERLVYGLPSRGVLEIKCPFFNGDMSKAVPWSRVPLYCIPQAQGLMEIMDRDWMDFYVWTPKGSSLFRLYRDVEYWHVLKIALSDFWWNHVQPARELCSKSVITDPLYQLRTIRPAPRHELCSYIVYESRRVVNDSNLLMREIYGKLQN
ncbi:hypothetical protein CFP56_014411 [Quercus suber]|uniref:YqaJ viral recombinase domain-containing protein n=1 Tax=Quercus suber TaxID=58331 RepID=A0AAW0KVE5_QUESU